MLFARCTISSGHRAGTPVAEIARAAGVSVDTLYETVGLKPQLLLAVHDMELAGADAPVEAERRDYVRAIRAAPTAAAKITTYAEALARLSDVSQRAYRRVGASSPSTLWRRAALCSGPEPDGCDQVERLRLLFAGALSPARN